MAYFWGLTMWFSSYQTVVIYDLEADFRFVGHLFDSARNGRVHTIVRGNDTDILVKLLRYLPILLQYNCTHTLLHDCGTCDSRFMLNINHIGNCIRLGRCRG